MRSLKLSLAALAAATALTAPAAAQPARPLTNDYHRTLPRRAAEAPNPFLWMFGPPAEPAAPPRVAPAPAKPTDIPHPAAKKAKPRAAPAKAKPVARRKAAPLPPLALLPLPPKPEGTCLETLKSRAAAGEGLLLPALKVTPAASGALTLKIDGEDPARSLSVQLADLAYKREEGLDGFIALARTGKNLQNNGAAFLVPTGGDAFNPDIPQNLTAELWDAKAPACATPLARVNLAAQPALRPTFTFRFGIPFPEETVARP